MAKMKEELESLRKENAELLKMLSELKLDCSGTHPRKFVPKTSIDDSAAVEEEPEDPEPARPEDSKPEDPEPDPVDEQLETVDEASAPSRKATRVKPVAKKPTRPDGPGKAYIYWDCESRMWVLTEDFWVALQLGGDLWEVIWVWYQDGSIHHVMTKKEIKRYLP